MTQSLIVALLVLACTLRAAWILAPAAARRPLARALLALPLPRRMVDAMRSHADATGGCACDGCERGATAAKAPSTGADSPAARTGTTVAPITFHPRKRP